MKHSSGDEEFALMPIKSLEFPNPKSDVVYNFTVDTPEHLYELPNGIITHQCCRSNRLRELRKRGGGLLALRKTDRWGCHHQPSTTCTSFFTALCRTRERQEAFLSSSRGIYELSERLSCC